MSAGSGPLVVAGELTIQTAAEEKVALLAFLDAAAGGQAAVELDLGQVTELDTAGVQLLLMLKREAAGRGRQLRLVRSSHTVSEVLGIAHLDNGLDPVGPHANEEAGR